MNEQTISEKFTRVDAALDRIRIKTNTENNAVEDVATAVEALVNPSGTLNINTNGIYNISNYASVNVQTPIQIEPKYVTFYDYDGTILFAYTEEEIEEMTELPTPSGHEGLVFECWNWTLAEIKNEGKKVNVGALYHSSSGCDIESTVTITNTTVELYQYSCGITDAEIFWGDGTSDRIATNVGISHTYSSLGTYTIGIKNYSNNNYYYTFPFTNITDYTQVIFGNSYLDADSFIDEYTLETVIMSNNTRLGLGGNKFLNGSIKLKHINLPRCTEFLGIDRSGIKGICFPGNLTTINEWGALYGSDRIKHLIFPNSLTTYGSGTGFSRCAEEILLSSNAEFPGLDGALLITKLKLYSVNTSIPTIANCPALLTLDLTDYSTVPTLSESNYSSLHSSCGIKYVVVKDGMLDAYRNASNEWRYAINAFRFMEKTTYESTIGPL